MYFPATQRVSSPTKFFSQPTQSKMFTFTKQINSADAFKQIVALTANFEHLTVPQAAAIQKTVLKNLPADTVFGYVMYPNTILTEQDITKAMRYNDSKDINLIHFSVWYEVEFAWIDFNAQQIMCWGTQEHVKDALDGIHAIFHNAISNKEEEERLARLAKCIQREEKDEARYEYAGSKKEYLRMKHM